MLKTKLTAILFIILLVDTGLPMFSLPVVMAIFLGFIFRITYNWNNNTITWKDTIVRLVFALGSCYLLLFAWIDWAITYNMVYTACGVSFMSLEIVNEANNLIQLGIKRWSKKVINSILAKDEHI